MTDQQHFTAGAIEAAQMGLHKIKQNEMNAKELRIGNLLQREGGMILSVSVIEEKRFIADCNDWGYPSDDFEIEPIPLDESWLIRAGFIYHNPSDFYSKTGAEMGQRL